MIWNESVWASRPLKEDTDLKKYPIYLQGVECCAKRETKCERRNKGKKKKDLRTEKSLHINEIKSCAFKINKHRLPRFVISKENIWKFIVRCSHCYILINEADARSIVSWFAFCFTIGCSRKVVLHFSFNDVGG